MLKRYFLVVDDSGNESYADTEFSPTESVMLWYCIFSTCLFPPADQPSKQNRPDHLCELKPKHDLP